MSSISYQRLVDGSPDPDAAAVTVTLSDSTATYGIINNTTGAAAVAAGTAVTVDVDTATYTYETDDLAVGSYTAVWKVVADEGTTYVIHVFVIDAAESSVEGVTLAEIERAFAPKVGPYRRRAASGGSAGAALIPSFRSSQTANQDVVDMYVLRRGLKADGSAVSGFNDDDRVRLIASLDTDTGSVVPDYNWTVAPVDTEMIEFHHLHPDDELRAAVLAGLKRCYIEDQASVVEGTAASHHGLTSALPWLTSVKQVRGVRDAYGLMVWYRVYSKLGHVWINTGTLSQYQVQALRPAYSYVNGASSRLGPDDDSDILRVPLEFAVAAAHVAAWDTFPARMLDAARQGLQWSPQQAAAHFTKISRKYNQRRTRFPLQPYNPSVPSGWGPLL